MRAQPDTPRPDGHHLDGHHPDGHSPDGHRPDEHRPEWLQPERRRVDKRRPGAGRADKRCPDKRRPDSGTSDRRRPARRAARVIFACGVLASGAAVTGLALASHSGHGALAPGTVRPLAAPAGPTAAPPGGSGSAGSATTAAVARPVALTIPVIGVHTRLIKLGITRTGALQVPKSTAVAGWYTGGPRPGAVGSAVIAGHIDSYRGPGVFFRLRLLRSPNRIYVRRADGTLAVFRVTSVHTYLKNHFPTQAVYGPAPGAQLRLITCGGTFDRATGSYLSNVVVYAAEVPGHTPKHRHHHHRARYAPRHPPREVPHPLMPYAGVS